MGIKQLTKLIKEKCPRAVVSRKLQHYASSKIAIDASLCIYQFLVAVRSEGVSLGYDDSATSHLVGMFYRTVRLVESGIVPVYVFDGKAPGMKIEELKKRLERRQKAERMLESAKEAEDKIEMERQEKRKVKIDDMHISECKRLLRLMGIPFVTAESEAEAYCAYLCKKGCVKAVATEDMDALCFGSPVLLRNVNISQTKKIDIDEYNLGMVLKDLDLTMDSFIDLCIMMGCDYCDTIKGVGYKRAYDYIKKHGSIENVLSNEKLDMPENFDFVGARGVFRELSEIGETASFSISYDDLDRNGLVEYLCKEKGFAESRVLGGIDKMVRSRKGGCQTLLDSFFTRK